jgi:hypothetical protein
MMTHLQRYLDDEWKDNTKIYVTGHFNFPNIEWETMSYQRSLGSDNTMSCDVLLNFLSRNFLSQIVDTSTRGDNILDLVITNDTTSIIEVSSSPTSLSDHNLVEVKLGFDALGKKKPDPPKGFEKDTFHSLNIHDADTEGLKGQMEKIDWVDLYFQCPKDDDGASFAELIRLTVLQLCIIHCPPKKPPQAKRKLSRNKSILYRKRCKMKARLECLQKHQPDSPVIQVLKDNISLLQIDLRDVIVGELNTQERKAVETIKSNPRYFYSYAKRFAKVKNGVGPLRDRSSNTLRHRPKDMANILQEQFYSVFSDPYSTDLQQTMGIPQGEHIATISSINFTKEDIVLAIDELDNYAATAHEDIPAKILKDCKHAISTPLAILWKWSMTHGAIPQELKAQYIAPIYKKGNKTDPANYRPISLTSHVTKIFERVIRNRLVAFLEDNNLISSTQHGFRKGRSCLTQLLQHYDRILKNLNEGFETDVIYLDFAKAFDKVDHNILLQKLQRYGIRGELFAWIKAFLSNRTQTVVVNGQHSLPRPVISGVPQGSVLGPILFILYINDLHKVVCNCNAGSFADDTKIEQRIDISEDADNVQRDLDDIIEWSKKNNMVLHEDKFMLLRYKTNKSTMLDVLPFTSHLVEYVTSSGHILRPQETARDLGVELSSDYKWTVHINKMVCSARKTASWVLGVFKDRSKPLMLQLFKSLVRSRVEYCCPLWNPLNVTDIQTIEDIQRHFTRHIAGTGDLNYWERLSVLNLQSLQRRRERYMIIHVWKMLNNLSPNDIGMQFTDNARLGKKVKIPAFNKAAPLSAVTLYDSSFAVHAGKLWNTLPGYVTSPTKLDIFKIQLGKFLRLIPDNPPVKGYHTSQNRNSIIDWRNQSGGLQNVWRPC